jgi:Fe-S-cluster containining protein
VEKTVKVRKTPFSYQCRACNKCCYGKGIQVNPYEAMRLSSFLEITTTKFIDKYLNGQMLKHQPESDACIFLGEKGCSVHKHRPLACRLYPLGRLRKVDGQELFTEVTSHPESAGEFGTTSTVGGYLKTQEVTSYLQAEEAYMELVTYLAKSAFDELDPNSKKKLPKRNESELNYVDWILNPDPVIAQYCKLKGIPFPSETEQKLKWHLEALRKWADGEWEPEK